VTSGLVDTGIVMEEGRIQFQKQDAFQTCGSYSIQRCHLDLQPTANMCAMFVLLDDYSRDFFFMHPLFLHWLANLNY
jgi:hypothetical protein